MGVGAAYSGALLRIETMSTSFITSPSGGCVADNGGDSEASTLVLFAPIRCSVAILVWSLAFAAVSNCFGRPLRPFTTCCHPSESFRCVNMKGVGVAYIYIYSRDRGL